MDIRELRAYVTVVAKGSYSAAAPLLGVSRQAVTKSVEALERQVGEPLLKRGKTGFVPTIRGRQVAAEAQRVVDEFDDFCDRNLAVPGRSSLLVEGRRQAGWLHGPGTGGPGTGQVLDIALVTGGYIGLPEDLLERYANLCPSVSLSVWEMTADEVVTAVVAGTVPIGIVGSHPELLVGLDFRLVVRQGLWLFVPRESELAQKPYLDLVDLDGRPMVTAGSSNHLHAYLVGKCRQAGVMPRFSAIAEGTGTINDIAREQRALYFGLKNPNTRLLGSLRPDDPDETDDMVFRELRVDGAQDFGTYEVKAARHPLDRAARHFWRLAAGDYPA